jgi:fibronectin type 3 domain-containing protein
MTGTLVAGTTFVDNTVQAGQTYYYVVTAVDASGNESVFSNEISATIPTP